jgi:hypothetical protein
MNDEKTLGNFLSSNQDIKITELETLLDEL